jgi:hypothetical protein
MKFVSIVSSAVVVVAAGCSSQQAADPSPSPQASSPSVTSSSAAPTPSTSTTVSQFDAQWMGLVPNQPQGWEEFNRTITGEFQQFGLRPTDETEIRFTCNGCAPWTVDLTAYAPGKFDPTEARKGKPVTVNGDGDGFLVEDPAKHATTLTWLYADNAWATVRGMTSATTELDRMVELAHALQPAERTPIRLPLYLPNLPDEIPLAQIDVDTHRDEPEKPDYGTMIDFAGCGLTDMGATRACRTATDSLSVQIAPRDYRVITGGVAHHVVPVKVGGKDGLYDETIHRASVQLLPGMLAELELSGRDRQAAQDVLANVNWASDPGNEATWPAVSEWAK